MALTQRGNKVYAKISDLSEESSLKSGDKIVFHSSSNGIDCIVDWANIRIDLDHTTFKNSYNEMLDFSRNAGEWVTTISQEFENLETQVKEIAEQNVSINNQLAAIKLLLQMVIGIAALKPDSSPNFPEEAYLQALTEEAREAYEQIKQEILNNSGYGEIDFSMQNLLYISATS